MVESTIRYSKSGSSDIASKIRHQTPLRLQRLKRRNTLFQSPNASGRSRQGAHRAPDRPRTKSKWELMETSRKGRERDFPADEGRAMTDLAEALRSRRRLEPLGRL